MQQALKLFVGVTGKVTNADPVVFVPTGVFHATDTKATHRLQEEGWKLIAVYPCPSDLQVVMWFVRETCFEDVHAIAGMHMPQNGS